MYTFGAEIEKALARTADGGPHKVTNAFFERIAAAVTKNGGHPKIKRSDITPAVLIGVSDNRTGEVGLDNGFNLQETSSPVFYADSAVGLENLWSFMKNDLYLVQSSLRHEHASVINFSIHPLGKTDMKTYKEFVAPKSLYRYIWKRGWDHSAGIDGKAQNSPSMGVSARDAAKAVTTIIGAGAAFISLFGNSPFSERKISSYKETRLRMWERMMKRSVSAGDKCGFLLSSATIYDVKTILPVDVWRGDQYSFCYS